MIWAARFFTTLLILTLSRNAEANGRARTTRIDELPKFFCSRSGPTGIYNLTEGKIITLFEGSSYYANNQFCEWNLNTDSANRIQIVVDQWKLQYAPPQALCGSYDHIKVTDDSGFLVSWCQIRPVFMSPFYITSRGSNLTISFQSDGTTPKDQKYPGAQLSFKIFDASDCPPNWINHNNSCFTLKRAAQTWSDGQKSCNMEQANLASIVLEDEFSFLKSSFKDFSGKMWFGVNDKSVFGQFKWMDNSSVSGAFKAINRLKTDPFKHCGQVDLKEGTVEMADCEAEAAVLCRTTKGKVSKIYPIPLFKTDKGNEKDSKTSRGLLLGVLIPCVLLLLLIILTVILYRYRDNFSCLNRSQARTKRSDEEATRREEFSLTEPSAPAHWDEDDRQHQGSGQYIAPPTYEEALESNPI